MLGCGWGCGVLVFARKTGGWVFFPFSVHESVATVGSHWQQDLGHARTLPQLPEAEHWDLFTHHVVHCGVDLLESEGEGLRLRGEGAVGGGFCGL